MVQTKYTRQKNNQAGRGDSHHTKSWFAFYVRPRHEKKSAKRLRNIGVEVFCPLVPTMVCWSDRWKKVYKPLINGYVFARVTEQGRREVLEDPAILRTVFWNGRPAHIRSEEMEVMKLLIGEGNNIKMKPLHPGNKVKVTEGGHVLGIAGMEGVVVKVKGNKVTLLMESLQAQLSMTVPRHMLTRLESLCQK